jgi:hypothetical protein
MTGDKQPVFGFVCNALSLSMEESEGDQIIQHGMHLKELERYAMSTNGVAEFICPHDVLWMTAEYEMTRLGVKSL